MKILTDLSILLRRGLPLQWKSHDTHHFRVLPSNNAPMVCDYLVLAETLAAIHPVLPDALHALLEMREHHYGHAAASNQQVLSTVNLHTQHKVSCEGPNNELHAVMELNDVQFLSLNNFVLLHGDVQKEHMSVYNGRIVSFAGERGTQTLLAEPAALEKRYPGWARRWEIGRGLGLEQEELAQTVFTKSPPIVNSADITQVDFD